MPVIDYYISLNSPWTYLGSARFAAIAAKHGCTVDVKPAKFAESSPRRAACRWESAQLSVVPTASWI